VKRYAWEEHLRRREFITLVGSTAAMWWPCLARAQRQARIPRVGVLWHAANIEEETPVYQNLVKGFSDLGYIDGQNITLEHRFPNEVPELFDKMAAELVSLNCDVLVGAGAAGPHLKKATSTIPIVFMFIPDPIGAGLVENIARPGGNVTGLSNFSVQLSAKRLQYLKEIVPTVTRVGLLINPNVKISNLYVKEAMEFGDKIGVETQSFEVRSLSDFEPAFDAMVKAGMQGVVANGESLIFQARKVIANLALARSLPSCGYVRELLDAGCLISYGVDQHAMARRAAVYVDRILKGEKPAELPVEQPTTFELLINLKTADALGVVVPPTLIARADEVIE
jgi:putative tryptophan/tyrosine transport system substrate-binding protein